MHATTYQQNAVPPCEVGDRIELRRMGGDDPNPIPEGTLGTVTHVTKLKFPGKPTEWQIAVDWDINRSLAVIWPLDTIRRLPQ
jgi:hypothetical protein